MILQHVRPEEFENAYGILCRRGYPVFEAATPFGATWCPGEPGGSTAPHPHPDGETFFILEGAGQMRIGDETQALAAGSVVFIPAFRDHVLTNGSTEAPLVFLSVYWEELAEPPERVLISSAPPTPNGDLHLGHLSGPYLA